MRQQDILLRQLAEKVTDFIEPAIPYLIIGSRKAAEEAEKKFGPEVWEIKKKMWEKLCVEDYSELEIAARDIIIAPNDPEVKRVLVRGVIESFESNLNLVRELLYLIEKEEVQKKMAENSSLDVEQSLDPRDKVFEEFNRLLDEFLAKGSTFQDLEELGVPSVKMAALDSESAAEGCSINEKPWKYTHILLDQKTVTENSPIAARMRQIAEIKIKNQSKEAQRMRTLFLLVSNLKGPLKEEFMEKALDFACNIQYGDLRAEILSNIVPVLEGPRKAEFVRKAVYAASEIEDEQERALVFSSLARHLRGPGKAELIARILEFAFFIKYDDAKFQILSSLVPHLYGSEMHRSETQGIINTALELVSVLGSDFLKIESYSILLPFLNEQRKNEILGTALELAFNLKDMDMRPEAFSYIIPYLREPRKSEIIGEAFKLANEIKSDSRREEALSSLGAFV